MGTRDYLVVRVARAEEGCRYTGDPYDGSGMPCSDCCHDMMRLRDGFYRLTVSWACSRCGQPGGYHHRAGNCPAGAREGGVAWRL